ncbi:hypothetical protein EVAR_63738_1 [Eumeta japonica]|uniref:Uncharacterized protein n=1 Tax=Eumeta variegata TaxID=151549 RepID=A0A4C1ZS14_EUMVA|nr:hypothetical protein EVAR_63738_1 [Eumeta japonica]
MTGSIEAVIVEEGHLNATTSFSENLAEGDGQNATTSSSENLTCANLNQASSSNNLSQTNIPVEDKNATIRNVIRPQIPTLGAGTDSTNGTPDSSENDLATDLINTSPPSTSSLRLEDFNPQSKNRNEANTRNAARDESNNFNLISGINAIRLANAINGVTSLQRRNGYVVCNECRQTPSTSRAVRTSVYDDVTVEDIIADAQEISVVATKMEMAARRQHDPSEDEYDSDAILYACLSSTESEEDEIEEEPVQQSSVSTALDTREQATYSRPFLRVHILTSVSATSYSARGRWTSLICPPPAIKKYCMELRRKDGGGGGYGQSQQSRCARAEHLRRAAPPERPSERLTQCGRTMKNSGEFDNALFSEPSSSCVESHRANVPERFHIALPKEPALTVLGYPAKRSLAGGSDM